ncbi:MAG TPA: hypothetical protein VL147_14595 [Devosia sp.]|nr:hypothetical protein [Devosia sp.]
MSDISFDAAPTAKLVTHSVERSILVVSLALFAGCLHLSHSLYLNPSWEYLGMTYAPPDVLRYISGTVLVIMAGLLLPTRVDTPSSIFLISLAFIVYVPTVVITLALRADALFLYGWQIIALSVAFFAGCVMQRRDSINTAIGALPDKRFIWALLAVWAVASVATVWIYSGRLRLVGFDDTYEQREVGVATSAAVAYLQTYYLNVICPAVLAVGLLDRRRPWLLLIGLGGFLLAYAVAAQKTALFVPFAMLGLYAAMTAGRIFGLTATVATVLALAIAAGTAMYVEGGGNWFAAIVVHRTIAIPGLTFSQYSDFFSQAGYTYWSHVRGLNSLVPPPASLANNPMWPQLGYLVGEYAYGDSKQNLNANLFSSDGVAAAGAAGVLAIGAVFTVWLRLIDWAGQGWDQRFAALVLLPVAVSLTNGPLFTVLLSFGGIFWALLFAVYKPKKG